MERKVLRKFINKNYVNRSKRYSNTYIYETSKVVPFCKYAISQQTKFIEKLAVHENSLMNEILEAERNINITELDYLSPVGVLDMSHDDTDNISMTAFYIKPVPGNSRG